MRLSSTSAATWIATHCWNLGGADAQYIMLQIYLSQFSIVARSSWLNCALRGDDAKKGEKCAESADIVHSGQWRAYWMVLGGTGSIQGDTGWVSIGPLCLWMVEGRFIIHQTVDIWSGVTKPKCAQDVGSPVCFATQPLCTDQFSEIRP